jgi:hypothetical protein
MKIRIGFEITYGFVAPTPMMLMLNVHPSRAADIIKPDQLRVSPRCRSRAISTRSATSAPVWWRRPGQLDIRTDALVADSGLPDVVEPAARQHEVAELAARRLGVPAGQPILRDRAADGGRVVALRQHAAGMGAGAGDLRLRPFPRALRLPARARHQDRDRRHHRTPRRVP